MKTFTLWQPWASLVAIGAKRVETRSWSTKYRGPLAIHAGKRCEVGDLGPYNVERDNPRGTSPAYLMRGPIAWPYRLPLGAVVASCRLVDVVPIIDDCGTDMDAPPHVCRSGGTLLLHRPDSDPFHDGETEPDLTSELPFGDFSPGRYAWLLEDVQPFDLPVPARGRQGLWEWAA